MEEIWKEYKTRETRLRVSNFGNVEGVIDKKPITIKIINGRRCVNNHHYPIYSLVWKVFRGEVPTGLVVHHLDWDKLNDRLDNLIMMTNDGHARLHNMNKQSEFKDHHHTEESKQINREKHSGKNNTCFGLHWYNNEINNKHFKNDIEAAKSGYFNKGKLYVPRKNKPGFVQWNKGLTKETDERVANYSHPRKTKQNTIENNITE